MATKKLHPTSNKAFDRAMKLTEGIRTAKGSHGTEYRLYVLVYKDGEKHGRIGIRWSDCSEGIRCTTSMTLWGKLANGKDADGIAHTVWCQGYGYDMEGCNMRYMLDELRPWLLERGFKLPERDPDNPNYYNELREHWKQIFEASGYKVIYAL